MTRAAVMRRDPMDHATCSAPRCKAEPNALAPFPLCARHLREAYEFCLSLVDERWVDAVQEMHREEVPQSAPRLLGRDAFMKRPGFVYFIRKDGLIKIGWSSKPKQRFHALQPDEVLHIMPGTMDDEHALHLQFDRFLARGAEYFHPDPDLLAFIAHLKAPEAATPDDLSSIA